MSGPPRDEDGYVQPHNDYGLIPNESLLVRYVQKWDLTPKDDGKLHLSKSAFSASSKDRDRYQGMSVDLLQKLERDAVNISTRMRPQHQGAVLLQAGCLRQLGLMVGSDPMLSQDLYHCAVWGISAGLRKKIRKQCCVRWLVQPKNAAAL